MEHIYALRGTHLQNILGVYMSIYDAERSLKEVEDFDKSVGIYEPNTYEIAKYSIKCECILA